MIIETRYAGPTNTHGSKITVRATAGDSRTDYRASYGYPHEASNAHEHCVKAFMADLIDSGHCPVMVNAGEASNGRGYRYVVLDAAASCEAGIAAFQAAGFHPGNNGNIFKPVHLSLPMVPEEGQRVALAPHLDVWMQGFMYGTVTGRVGATGLRFKVSAESLRHGTRVLTLNRANFSTLSSWGGIAWDFAAESRLIPDSTAV